MVGRREVLHLGGATGLALLGAGSARAEAGETLLTYGAAPQNLATPIAYFDRLLTPTPVFFVRSHFGPPALDVERKLVIEGLVKERLELGLADLRLLPEVTLTAVLQCAGNGRALHVPRVPGVQWVHGAMGQATWTGVRLRDLLARAGVSPEAAHVLVQGADLPPKPSVPAFVRSLPRARALDASTLVAYRMNGEPLSLAHGAPFRLVVPGWAGDHWVKWLTRLRAQKDEAEGFFYRTAYRMPLQPVAPGASVPPEQMRPAESFPIKSLIARPADGGSAPSGPQTVVGVAFCGDAGIARVEVSVDGARSWTAAALEGPATAGAWRVFRHRFRAERGERRTAVARAIDSRGRVQPEHASWNPSGYFWNGWHVVSWEVT